MDFKLDAFPVDDTTGGIRSTEKIRIIICPNTLHEDAVGRVTSPVTQVEVVAVKSASR